MIVKIEIHNVNDKLPESGKQIWVLGEQAGMNPSMGGKYWFKSHRIKPTDAKKLNTMNRRYYDDNGFHATYVSHWCAGLPTTF